MDRFLDGLPLGVRIFTASSALLLMIGSIATVAAPANYTNCIVSLYLIGLGTLSLLCEFSPYGLNVLMGVCPLLGEYSFRGILYILVGLLPLGIDSLGLWSGILMIVSGFLNLIIHALLPVHPYSFYGAGRNSDVADDDEEARFADDPEGEEIGALR